MITKVIPKTGGRVLTPRGTGTVTFVSTGRYATTVEVKLDSGRLLVGPADSMTYLGAAK